MSDDKIKYDADGNPVNTPGQVDAAADPLNSPPVGPDGTSLVPGTTDEQIVADRNDSSHVVVHEVLGGVVERLDEVIGELGKDLSAAVVHDERAERVKGAALKVALDALESARAVVAAYAPEGATSGTTVATTQGVV